MKKMVVLFFLFFILKTSVAQTYRPFDSTTVWSAEYGYKYSSSTCYLLENQKYYMSGYVMDLGRMWHKVYFSRVTKVHPSSSCSTAPTIPPPVYNVIKGYLYNDVLNKKVYLKSTAPSSSTLSPNDVWYDFNKTIGDSLYFRYPSYTFPNYKFKINSTDSILFSGNYHKRFIVTCVPLAISIPNSLSFVEGIGSSLGPFDALINPMGEAYTNLLCFSSPSQTLAVNNHTAYTNSSVCSNLVLEISETKEFSNSIYPNPASDHIYITTAASGIQSYEIFNSLGQIQLSGIAIGETKINTETLSNGIYFVKLSTPQHYCAFQRRLHWEQRAQPQCQSASRRLF